MNSYYEEDLFPSVDMEPSTKKKNASVKKTLHHFSILIFMISVIIVGILFVILYKFNYDKIDGKLHYYCKQVATDCGEVVGVTERYNNKEVFIFKGIPYAKPPVGNLRWKPPEPLKKSDNSCWKGVYKATEFGSECIQAKAPSLTGKEDCLFLNVWTPNLNLSKGLPVFVWIHGGALIDLYGNFPGYSPDSEFVTSMNVVAVSMNYRLNAFGFLTLKELWDEGKSYGNYGIMDQILALKWIQSNIKNFGGDPDSVTVVGQSSGGTSIYGLLASPLADTLFHKAIPMSGSPKFVVDYKQASQDNKVFVERTRCMSFSGTRLKECLYNLTAYEIFKALPLNVFPYWATPYMLDFPKKDVIYGALIVTDPVVIKVSPQEIKALALKNKKSILTGTTAQEVEYGRKLTFTKFSVLEDFLHRSLIEFSPSFPAIVLNNLYNLSQYWNEKPVYLYITMTTDVRVTCPNNVLFKDFSENQKLESYRYVVSNRPTSPIKMPALSNYTIEYSVHAWDSTALFNYTMVSNIGFQPSVEELKFRDNLRAVVKEFMISGSLAKFGWYANTTAEFTRDGTITVLSSDYHYKECQFWSNKSNGFLPYQWVN